MTAEDLSVPAADLMIVGHYDRGPGYATRRASGSPSWLLMWTQTGAGLVEQAGASFTAGPGDLVVLGSHAAHHYRVAPGGDRWRFWWVHFQPRPSWLTWLGPYTLAAGCHLVEGVPTTVHARIDRAFGRALQDTRWIPPGSDEPPQPGAGPAVAVTAAARELVLGAVEEVLVLATASARRSEQGGDPRVERVLALIAAEPGARHSVASLARSVALSPSRLAHLFAEQTRRTPMRAVREARIRHAARLLEVTDLDIGQVAAAAGFVSPFHFSRAFRQEYGMPPRDYRTRLRPPS
ncbi:MULTISPECIES: helix-turn-helix domain-containing protein [Streptosporangium]|uniref:AraC family transcriptional regulator of arabinose operon n=1 Tax=Streptosporangium brasiliense TaxID=47480 RepID=A0ABT9RGH4_9ACTN|nr:helix-turn-helix domain-containing protein [Streptosporangium brasiliense]MDP9868350.1 AraC family transcriptional regulator of arabinose operon [Streptosporangium brasiliense]